MLHPEVEALWLDYEARNMRARMAYMMKQKTFSVQTYMQADHWKKKQDRALLRQK